MFQGGYSIEAYEKPLRAYQNTAVEWELNRFYVNNDSGAGKFLDPGLGKTRSTLTVMDYLFRLGEIKKALIVAPLRPVYTVWPNEIKRWGFPYSWCILHGPKGTHQKMMRHDCQIEIVNYEGFSKLLDVKKRWDYIALDESTWVKNWSAQRSRNCRKVIRNQVSKTKKVFRDILTGTPAANCLSELFAQIHCLDDGEALGKTLTFFRNNYCQQGGWYGRKWSVCENRQEDLRNAIRHLVITMKAEDHLDMPRLVINDVMCQMSNKHERMYKQLKEELATTLESNDMLLCGSAAAAYNKCRQFANGLVYQTDMYDGLKTSVEVHKIKMDAIAEIAGELGGKPLLVGYFFTHDAERLQKRFKGAPIIRGQMKIQDVSKIIREWNTDKYPILIGQWDAIGHGLNLQDGSCNDVAFYGVPDRPEVYDQFFRRVYRQGVNGSQVRIHRILTAGTVDELMVQRLEGKFSTQEDFLKGLRQHGKN